MREVSTATPQAARAGTLFHPPSMASVLTRLRTITPTSERRWGRMTAHRMVCHLSDAFRGALGDRPALSVATPLSRTVLRWVALTLPAQWPKARIATLPEADQELGGTPPTEFLADRAELERLIERFVARAPELEGHEHAIFGTLSRAEWGRWGYRHLDHHLRQFGA
jgi:hypothetical protein